jgi:transcriptional regulator with XRE-family HTH domain
MAAEIDPAWWDDAAVDGRPLREALARRDIAAVFRFLRCRGFSRSRIAALTGLSETRVRQVGQGQQQVSTYEVLERVALGLGIPRTYLGLGYGSDGAATQPETPGTRETYPLGLVWQASLRDTVETVADLWRADMERRALLHRSLWLSAALAAPTRDWLLDMTDDDLASKGSRAVGAADVEVVWSMCHAFTDADHRLGGGYARTALGQYVTDSVFPLLSGTYSQPVGRRLMAAAARLCNLGGFMAFDCRLHGLAQRYFVQALRLAHAAGDRALGAHILGDMAMQAHYLGEPAEAVTLASAGVHTAASTGSRATTARCQALLARARALAGDQRGCALAMSQAEDALARVQPADEPPWIRFFGIEQMHAEFAYAASDLGRHDDVRRFASAVPATPGQMERRRVLLASTLAASYLPAPHTTNPAESDIDQACATLVEIAPLLGSLTTERGRHAVAAVRSRLRPHATRPAVRQLNSLFAHAA